MNDTAFLDLLETTALAAGVAIMAVRTHGPHVRYKSDESPVTEADQRAETLILNVLAAHYPDVSVVAEELRENGQCPLCVDGRFFLVDALDGTREFIRGRDEFTVNIALVEDGWPVAGVVYAPALRRLWRGGPGGAEVVEIDPEGGVVNRLAIRTRPVPERPLALRSVSHYERETDDYLTCLPPHDTGAVGSSLKFCMLAEGKADIYPRLTTLMQWDTAAGDAVLRAAGGLTIGPGGAPLSYGQRDGA